MFSLSMVKRKLVIDDQYGIASLKRLTRDFNEIIENGEKSGGPLRAEEKFGVFRNFLALHDLFNLKYSGNFLSWRGKRGNHLVYCRLDRALGNSSWSDVFPNGRSHYLEFQGSDHHPLMSFFDTKSKKKKRSVSV